MTQPTPVDTAGSPHLVVGPLYMDEGVRDFGPWRFAWDLCDEGSCVLLFRTDKDSNGLMKLIDEKHGTREEIEAIVVGLRWIAARRAAERGSGE